jgi:hypothetical protein
MSTQLPFMEVSRLLPEEAEALYIKVMTTKLTPEREAQLDHYRDLALRALSGEYVTFPTRQRG